MLVPVTSADVKMMRPAHDSLLYCGAMIGVSHANAKEVAQYAMAEIHVIIARREESCAGTSHRIAMIGVTHAEPALGKHAMAGILVANVGGEEEGVRISRKIPLM